MIRMLLWSVFILLSQLSIAQLSPQSPAKAYFDIFPALAGSFEATHTLYYPAPKPDPYKALENLIDDNLDSLLKKGGTKSAKLLWTVILDGREGRRRGNEKYDDNTLKDEKLAQYVGTRLFSIGQAESQCKDEADDCMKAQLAKTPNPTYHEWDKVAYTCYKNAFIVYFNIAKKTLLEIDAYLQKSGMIAALTDSRHKYHIQMLELEARILARIKSLSKTAGSIERQAAQTIEKCKDKSAGCDDRIGVVNQP